MLYGHEQLSGTKDYTYVSLYQEPSDCRLLRCTIAVNSRINATSPTTRVG